MSNLLYSVKLPFFCLKKGGKKGTFTDLLSYFHDSLSYKKRKKIELNYLNK